MNLPEPTAVPCAECPWRRASAPGWLGPFDAQEWVALVHSEDAVACHMTISKDGSWDGGVRQCAGAARYRKNVCKLPRDPQVACGPLDRETVFTSSAEFLQHHQRGEK